MSRSDPTVAVLTPTYNHGRFLGSCIESVLAQTFPGWEMVILDDGSTDETRAVASRYDDRRIRYVRQERVGIWNLADTYNHALALSRAPFVAILEGDDYWPADRLEVLLPSFDASDVDVAFGKAAVVGETGPVRPWTIPVRSFHWRVPARARRNDPIGSAARAMLDPRWLTFAYPCALLLRRRALERIGGFQKRAHLPLTDYPTLLRLSMNGRFSFRDRVTGYWRYHVAGTTLSRRRAILEGVREESRAFRAAFADELALRPREVSRLERQWRFATALLEVEAGRKALVERDWPTARSRLRAGLHSGSMVVRAMAAAGLFACTLGLDLEPLFEFTGFPWFRLDADGTARFHLGRL